MDAKIEYFKGAKWATLSGAFTPDELREIATEIEVKDKQFQKDQKKSNKG